MDKGAGASQRACLGKGLVAGGSLGIEGLGGSVRQYFQVYACFVTIRVRRRYPTGGSDYLVIPWAQAVPCAGSRQVRGWLSLAGGLVRAEKVAPPGRTIPAVGQVDRAEDALVAGQVLGESPQDEQLERHRRHDDACRHRCLAVTGQQAGKIEHELGRGMRDACQVGVGRLEDPAGSRSAIPGRACWGAGSWSLSGSQVLEGDVSRPLQPGAMPSSPERAPRRPRLALVA